MSITGVKNFQIGAILTAADLNTYNRGVFVFASAAARTSAFSSAGITLAEGWFSYLVDTNSTEFYNGAAWEAVATANVVSTVASASSIAVTGPGTYLLTGTTAVATITGGSTGMTITVQASAQASGVPVVLTYGTGANAIKLAGGRSLGIYAQVPADTAAGAGESVTLRYDGTAWVEIARDLRTFLVYTQKTTSTSITGGNEAGATTAITADVFTADGATPLRIDFYSYEVDRGTTNITVILSKNTTSMGYWGSINISYMPMNLSRRDTPTAAATTYAVKAYVDAGTGTISGGLGGTSQAAPAFISIRRDI